MVAGRCFPPLFPPGICKEHHSFGGCCSAGTLAAAGAIAPQTSQDQSSTSALQAPPACTLCTCVRTLVLIRWHSVISRPTWVPPRTSVPDLDPLSIRFPLQVKHNWAVGACSAPGGSSYLLLVCDRLPLISFSSPSFFPSLPLSTPLFSYFLASPPTSPHCACLQVPARVCVLMWLFFLPR